MHRTLVLILHQISHQNSQGSLLLAKCWSPRERGRIQLCLMFAMYWRTCDTCIMNTDCGFCYIESDAELAVNGSCLAAQHNKQGDVIFNESAYGRCQQSTLHEPLHWAYSFCPTKFAWMATFGLVLYLIFFASGRPRLLYQHVWCSDWLVSWHCFITCLAS